ncbi:MAG: response regulator [Saprospiraceae bacterium]|nr:response regulator [Saprospiraceae bacterium]
MGDFKKQVLIIEDSISLRTLMAHMLGKKYNVTAKSNGLEALAWIESGNQPDAIVLDINMPKLNGVEFIKNIKCSGIHNHIPMVVVSGSVDTSEEQDLKSLGIDNFLYKPFRPEELLEQVELCCNKFFV